MLGPRRWTKRALVVVALVVAVSAVGIAGGVGRDAAAQLEPPPAEPLPAAYVLVDADTGEVLEAHNEHEPMLVASTIKLLTALTALEHVPSDTILTVSDRAEEAPAFEMNMQAGEQWRFLDTLSAMLIVSANDAAYALAEASAGTVESFSEQMTATGERLGTRDSTFHDPSGLDDEFSIGGSDVSAWDLAVIGRNALAVPAIAERAALENDTIVDLNGETRTLPGRNTVFLSLYDGANGLKTGGTSAAGTHLVASATRDGRTLVAVVLGIPSTIQWAASLLDRGFAGDVTPTGESLPDVDVRLADTTRDAIAGAGSVLGRNAFSFDASAPTDTASVDDTAVVEEGADDSAVPAPSVQAQAASGSGGIPWVWITAGALVVLLTLGLLRRRAVRRRRKRRAERQRALAEARRRGMIDVIEPSGQGLSSVQVMRRRDP